MKILLIALMVVGVCGCNTMIGLGRDTKEGFIWCKRKVEESRQGRSGGGGGDSGEVPIY
jgi:hypothetical protein